MSNILPIIALISGLLSLVAFIFIRGVEWGKLNTRLQTVEGEIGKIRGIELKIERIETQLQPFWHMIETKLANMLKAPHNPRKDELLNKLANEINKEELTELYNSLDEDLNEAIKGKDDNALIIGLVMSRVEARLKCLLFRS